MNTPADMHKEMYMLANLAVGGYWPGVPDASTEFPAHMLIDHVRAYAYPGTVTVTDPIILVLPENGQDLVASTAVAHVLTGNAGANHITGHAGADTLNGLAGNDTLDGSGGVDRLVGGVGHDFYIVGAGDVVVETSDQGVDTVHSTTDTVTTLGAHLETLMLGEGAPREGNGNALANLIMGNAGANFLRGMSGADTLAGGGGADTLAGGLGQDVLVGGAGADRFRFVGTADSRVAAPDRVLDFTFGGAASDRISLSVIDANVLVAGNQAFGYIGAGAFTGAAGQLRVEAAGAGSWLASGDTDGDASADFAITIFAATKPVTAWFIL